MTSCSQVCESWKLGCHGIITWQVFWIYSSVFNGPIPEEAHKIDTPELAARAEEITKHAEQLTQAVRSRGVPTIPKVQDGKVEVIDHAAFYGRPERITAFAA